MKTRAIIPVIALLFFLLLFPGAVFAEGKNQGSAGLDLGWFPGLKVGYTRHTEAGFFFGLDADITFFLPYLPVTGSLTGGWRFIFDNEMELRPFLIAGGGGYFNVNPSACSGEGECCSVEQPNPFPFLHAGAGLDWRITPYLILGLEGGLDEAFRECIPHLFFARLTIKYVWFD